MPTVRNIRVYTLERDALTVSWEIEYTLEDLATYSISIWRSESGAGPYQRVSNEMNAQDVYEFQDRGLNLFSKWREFYYRVRLTKGADGSFVEFGSTDPLQVLRNSADPGGVVSEAPPDIEALESIRRFALVLREFSGRRVLVLSERTWGQRCPACWDNLKRRRNKANCKACFDTGVAGGYFRPVETFASKPSMQQQVQLTPLFEMQPNDQAMYFAARPRIKPRDLVIDIDGRRWRVLTVAKNEKAWALTRQVAQVRMVSRDQVEYDIPIEASDWSVDSLTAGPMRQHLRSTDIDSYHKAVQDLGLGEQEVFPETSEIASDVGGSDASS